MEQECVRQCRTSKQYTIFSLLSTISTSLYFSLSFCPPHDVFRSINFYNKMNEHKNPTLFGPYFNLHPQDAFTHVSQLTSTLQNFIEAFKQRIQLQIDYSRSLLRISKELEKYISPTEPTPISYIASSFKVEHEERARHSLELAGYLHTEIQIPCESLLLQHQGQLRRVQRQLKKFERQGQTVEQSYQKHLKRYYKSRQDCEERMIMKNVLSYTPGASVGQREKALSKLEEERRECEEHRCRYMQALEGFNSFASRYNKTIDGLIVTLQEIVVQEVTLQADSMRKLIVSEINMFKNVEYDLLNISRQMEALSPGNQIECFVMNNKDVFQTPIISIYSEGPVVPYRYEIVDLKSPLGRSLMEETLMRIEKGLFPSLLQNKNSGILKEAVQKIMREKKGEEESEKRFRLEIFQQEAKMNASLRFVPEDRLQKLDKEELYPTSLNIIQGISEILHKSQQMPQTRMKQIYQHLQFSQGQHHFFRYLSFLSLNQYSNMTNQHIEDQLAGKHYLILTRVLIDRCVRTRDVFAARAVLSLLFTVVYTVQGQQRYLYQSQSIRQLQIWQSRDFWQATVFESTYELITLLPSIQRQCLKEVYLMRQKNTIFSGLITYCHYMVMLGTCEDYEGAEVSFVRSTMAKFSGIYRLLDEHQRDLSKTILHAYDQYKAQLKSV